MLYYRKFPVTKKIMDRRGVWGIKIFRRKLSCLTVPNFSQWNSFVLCFRKPPLAKKIKDKRGVIKIFHRQKFISQCRKFLWGNTSMLRLRKFPEAKNSMDNRGGGIKIFRRKIFVSLCRKFLQGNPVVLCFRKLPVARKIMD